MWLSEVHTVDGASSGDDMAGILGLAVLRGETRMGRIDQGSFDVSHSTESPLSLNHWNQLTGFAQTSVGVPPEDNQDGKKYQLLLKSITSVEFAEWFVLS